MGIRAVVFDLDGVLIESEQIWDEVRQALVAEVGGTWTESATQDQLGMSTQEWSSYLVEKLGVPGPPERVAAEVIDRVAERYGDAPPMIDGAVEVVRTVATRWPLGLATSSPPRLIDVILDAADLRSQFIATVSSEEVARGKPAPDVYREVCDRLDVDPSAAAAVEDSTNGIRSAAAAGLTVVAVPNREFPPAAEALELTRAKVRDIRGVPDLLATL